jgi:hypothetical protein
MTTKELKQKLGSMTDEEVSKFCEDCRLGDRPRDEISRIFVNKPELERRICDLLGFATEEEKSTEAATASAKADTSSARSAHWSFVCAVISISISLVALVASILAFLFR